MNPESSPFRPGQPVPIEFFVGRLPEIERLRGMVNASTQGRFKIGFASLASGVSAKAPLLLLFATWSNTTTMWRGVTSSSEAFRTSKRCYTGPLTAS